MTKTIAAVYENGVLRPTEPLALSEGAQVEITLHLEDAGPPRPLWEALAEIASLPAESPADGFSGADHDEVLYGGKDAR